MLYLIRHAATENNEANPPRIQGSRSDLGLAEMGIRQAQSAAQFLKSFPLSAIYSSPLRRARQTAQQIADLHQLEVRPVEALVEVDVGQWEGQSWEQIAQEHPEAHRLFLEDPATHPYLGGENLTSVLRRTLPAIEELFRRHQQEEFVVVSHNVTNRVLLAHLLKVPLRYARGISQKNCGINVISYGGGKLKLETVNSSFHLAGVG